MYTRARFCRLLCALIKRKTTRVHIFLNHEREPLPSLRFLSLFFTKQKSWLLFAIVCSVNFLYISFFSEFSHGSVNTHLLNSVYTMMTFIFCAKPVSLLHFYQPMIYAVCYTLFSLIWHYTGNEPVYAILDWDFPGATARTVVLITLVGIPLIHVLIFALYTFRKWVSEKCACTGNSCTQKDCDKKPQREVTSRDVELQLPYKTNSVHPEQ